MGRFVNADVYLSTGQGAIGFNLYSYCLNNAVNRVDISGSMSAVADVLNNSPWLLGLAAFDGPLPIGDIFAGLAMIVLLALTFEESEEDTVVAKIDENSTTIGGPGNTPTPTPKVTKGTHSTPKNGEPNSIYEQYDNQGNLVRKTEYNENGKPNYRDDIVGKSHYSKETKTNIKTPHRHKFIYNSWGQYIGEEVFYLK